METWPAPDLRERRNNLGWLAVSGRSDPIKIAVEGATAEAAAELYERKRQYWATLREPASDDPVDPPA